MKTFVTGTVVEFTYTNHRDEKALRRVAFQGLDYGDNEWYPERQWFLRGIDLDKRAYRSFALARIDGEEIHVWQGRHVS